MASEHDDTDGAPERSNRFTRGRDPWLAHLGNLRNVVRQEMVSRQLARHLPAAPARVLDVGAGQGTQALRLVAAGHEVTAVEPDHAMRDVFTTDAARLRPTERARVSLQASDLATLSTEARPATHDVVLCHGVLMYLPESRAAVAELARRVAPGGILSIVTRNGDALAWRPALRHEWSAALALLEEVDQSRTEDRAALYRNEIGVDARADTLGSLTDDCEAAGLELTAWYGIRVATDDVALDEPPPDAAHLATLLDVEERLGSTDPYRALGTLVHVIASRPGGSVSPADG
ncbi:MAG: methyltransferase domain-containing protein [Humibacillus sp.]|nr:methyltransferase domain-containing protein [Humibacillus sp.]